MSDLAQIQAANRLWHALSASWAAPRNPQREAKLMEAEQAYSSFALNDIGTERSGLSSRSNPPRIEPESQADNQDATAHPQSNAKTVDRQNGPNDTRGAQSGIREAGIPGCHAGKDGDCCWEKCPQIRDDEPKKTGRHCPLDDGRREG